MTGPKSTLSPRDACRDDLARGTVSGMTTHTPYCRLCDVDIPSTNGRGICSKCQRTAVKKLAR